MNEKQLYFIYSTQRCQRIPFKHLVFPIERLSSPRVDRPLSRCAGGRTGFHSAFLRARVVPKGRPFIELAIQDVRSVWRKGSRTGCAGLRSLLSTILWAARRALALRSVTAAMRVLGPISYVCACALIERLNRSSVRSPGACFIMHILVLVTCNVVL